MVQNKKNHWLEARWQVLRRDVDMLTGELELLGSLGCYQNIPLEPVANPEQTEILAYFGDEQNMAKTAKKLRLFENTTTKLITINRIPQGDWATAWKKYFKPFSLTKRVVIKPSWEFYDQKPGETVITLDPGMAFGTGQHDTTRFCAEVICELKDQHPNLESLIDVGCGSGILAIIAGSIGFKCVIGLDNDGMAIDTAKENLARNPKAGPMSFFHTNGSLDHSLIKPAQVVVANIIAEALCELKESLVESTCHDGFLILSGILRERSAMVEAAFADLKLIKKQNSHDWYAYLYCRQ